MEVKIIEFSMRFRSLRFLVFCKSPNVKIVFLHDQESQKRSKIHQKSMQKRRSEKWCQKEPKANEKGAQNDFKSGYFMLKSRESGQGGDKCRFRILFGRVPMKANFGRFLRCAKSRPKIEKFGTRLEIGLPHALGRRVGRRPGEGFWEFGKEKARTWLWV